MSTITVSARACSLDLTKSFAVKAAGIDSADALAAFCPSAAALSNRSLPELAKLMAS